MSNRKVVISQSGAELYNKQRNGQENQCQRPRAEFLVSIKRATAAILSTASTGEYGPCS